MADNGTLGEIFGKYAGVAEVIWKIEWSVNSKGMKVSVCLLSPWVKPVG